MLGKVLADDAVFQRLIDWRELRLARHPHQIGIAGILVGGGLCRHLIAVMPFDFERRQRQKQRTGKMTLGTDRGLRDRLLASKQREAFGQLRRRHIVLVDVVDGAGDGGAQRVERKAGNAPDAGFAGGKLCPIVGFADAERSDDAHAGHRDDRPAGFVAHHDPLLQ
jgi:hypothetical protein